MSAQPDISNQPAMVAAALCAMMSALAAFAERYPRCQHCHGPLTAFRAWPGRPGVYLGDCFGCARPPMPGMAPHPCTFVVGCDKDDDDETT